MAQDSNPNSGVTTYYDILEIPRNATPEEIKIAWRKKVKQYHPDKPENQTPNATAMMQAINTAYEGLGFTRGAYNPEKRAAYDRKISTEAVGRAGKTAQAYKRPADVYSEQQRRAQQQSTSTSKTYTPPPRQDTPPRRQEEKGLAIPGKNFAGNKAWQAFSKTGVGKTVTGMGAKVGGAIAKAVGGLGKLIGGLSNPLGWALTIGMIAINKKTHEYVVGGFLALGALFAGIGAAFVGLLGAGLALVGIITILVAIGTIVIVALILFIINSGAYIMPPATGRFGQGPIQVIEGCPSSMWPVNIEGFRYVISQGPGGTTSHGPPAVIEYTDPVTGVKTTRPVPYQEAIDIATVPAGDLNPGRTILATHTGTVYSVGIDQFGGKYIKITANCGLNFISEYIHMSSISSNITRGASIKTGDVLGVLGCTGICSGPHLHYEFRNVDDSAKNRNDGDPAPYMVEPFIPKNVPELCASNCGINVP